MFENLFDKKIMRVINIKLCSYEGKMTFLFVIKFDYHLWANVGRTKVVCQK
jgi:hypothetical protein